MLKVRDEIKHVMQSKQYSCGAAAFASIFDISEEEAMKLVGTRKSGTHSFMVQAAIRNNTEVNSYVISVDDEIKNLFWLGPISCRYPLYVSSTYVSQGLRGRPVLRRHAAALAGGYFYDPSERKACPIYAYEHTYNKKLIVNLVIIVESELAGWNKNFDNLIDTVGFI